MKITILTENCAGGSLAAEHGLSYLVEIDEKKILFDAGHSDIFLKNAHRLGIDPEADVDTLVLSHGHWDHGNGMVHIPHKRMITHPLAFVRRFRKRDLTPVGLSYTREEAEHLFDLVTTTQPMNITNNLIYLGEIPRRSDFEGRSTAYVDDLSVEDLIPDDSALVAVVQNALVVITGCSHSGICNIIEHAREVAGIKRVKAVIGGFHLKEQDAQAQKTVAYLHSIGVEQLYPSHCTELPALALFYQRFGIRQVKTGMVLQFI